jgi:cilia- and flagella-associated protein 45
MPASRGGQSPGTAASSRASSLPSTRSPQSGGGASRMSNRSRLLSPAAESQQTTAPVGARILHGVPPKARDVTVLQPSELGRLKAYARQNKGSLKVETGVDMSHRRQREGVVHNDLASTRKAAVKDAAAAAHRDEQRGKTSEIARREGLGSETALAKTEQERVKQNALRHIEMEADEAKLMSMLESYALAAAERDGQLAERKAAAIREREAELAVEAETLRREEERMKEYDQREVLQRQRDEAARRVIQQQILEHEEKELQQQAAVSADGEAMQTKLAREKAEDEAREKVRTQQRRVDLVANLQANKDAISQKERARHAEREEEQTIARYIKERDERDKARLAEEERIRAEKEKHWKQMLTSQKRVMDNRSEQDELRARRHQEMEARKQRERAKAEQEKEEQTRRELAEYHHQQVREKELLLAKMALREKEEHNRLVAEKEADLAKARQEAAQRERSKAAHLSNIQAQIEAAQDEKRRQALNVVDEGAAFRASEEVRKERLEAIRQEKIENLRARGVPEEYLHDLHKLKL